MTCDHLEFDECMYSAMEKRMLAESGCIVPWIASKEPDAKICTQPEVGERVLNTFSSTDQQL